MKKLLAIGFIWLGCSAAWIILGSTLVARTGDTSSELVSEVHSLWGPPMQQAPPRAVYGETHKKLERTTFHNSDGSTSTHDTERDETVEMDIALDRSDIAVKLSLEQRRKGLLWFPTYAIDFHAGYTFVNNTVLPRDVEVRFELAGNHAIYDGFEVKNSLGDAIPLTIREGVARWTVPLKPGERYPFTVAYRSRGTSTWGYGLTAGTGQVHDFRLVMDTDFAQVDFPAGTLSPSTHAARDGRWHGEWRFSSLVANLPIGLELPQMLNPGPLASKITFFAPVSLLFFFFVVAVFATAQRRRIHPLNFFFFGCAFFAFHLLFSYLVDHLSIAASFTLASAVSIFLVMSYARLFVGWKFALREMGIAQLIYLVLFSFTFFWNGFTGLAITIGAILTLFVMMQVTGRVSWDEPLAKPKSEP
jgi:hypothetical protein